MNLLFTLWLYSTFWTIIGVFLFVYLMFARSLYNLIMHYWIKWFFPPWLQLPYDQSLLDQSVRMARTDLIRSNLDMRYGSERVSREFFFWVESSSRGIKAHNNFWDQQGSRNMGGRFSQHYSDRCRDLIKRLWWYETVFDVPEQLKINLKNLWLREEKDIVDRGFSCESKLWRNQRITALPLCGFIHSLCSQIRKTVAQHYPHCPPTCFSIGFFGGSQVSVTALKNQRERNRKTARPRFWETW